MLYHLFSWLHETQGFPRLGLYVSFRIAAAFLSAFLLCLLLGPRFIAWQRRRRLGENLDKMGQERRALVPEGKAGTPTMGGLLIGCGLCAAALAWCRLDEPLVWLGLLVYCGMGAVGAWDDQVKLFHPTRHGLTFRTKLAWTAGLCLVVGLVLAHVVWTGPQAPLQALVLPFLKDADLSLAGLGALPFVALVCVTICGSANAVNLADGMDGLATGCLLVAGITLAAMCYVIGRVDYAGYLYVPHVAGAAEVAVLLAAMVGACFGFLWYNAAPAQLFMGDVGSLSLGALLGFAAVACRMELALVVVGGVFVVEALSVVLQVGSWKLRRKRVFLCAPIHHHFQKQGVPETKIVVRFWIAAVLLSCLSLTLFKLR
ncbi:MAG: phospho-N-acetylmuramoyl-pentapeptide-transferase [Planctomycetota bacterium]